MANQNPELGPSRAPLSNPFAQRPKIMASRNGTCTHLTMTRLYTREFRCGICYRIASMGWLYRCTQDRESLIEDDMEHGTEFKFDNLPDLFPRPLSPIKGSPAARQSKLSFLEEISDQALKTYSTAQLSQILTQRAHALDLAKETSQTNSSQDDSFYSTSNGQSTIPLPSFPSKPSSSSPSMAPARPPQRPWLPTKGSECQFKCCHFCRPSLNERAYLSLNGIANGDIPATAVVGFGFHLHSQARPVALVKHVQNLGLRPSPPPRPESSILPTTQDRHFYLTHHQPLPQGLGILNAPLPPAPLPIEARALPPLPSSDTTLSPLPVTGSIPADHPLLPINSNINQPSLFSPRRNLRSSSLGNVKFEIAVRTPLPEQTCEEVAEITKKVTPMGMAEIDLGDGFGSEDLKVVAVSEEAVEAGIADLITQV